MTDCDFHVSYDRACVCGGGFKPTARDGAVPTGFSGAETEDRGFE